MIIITSLLPKWFIVIYNLILNFFIWYQNFFIYRKNLHKFWLNSKVWNMYFKTLKLILEIKKKHKINFLILIILTQILWINWLCLFCSQICTIFMGFSFRTNKKFCKYYKAYLISVSLNLPSNLQSLNFFFVDTFVYYLCIDIIDY